MADRTSLVEALRDIEKDVAQHIPGMYGARHAKLQAAIDKVEQLAAYAESALSYVEAAADEERARHKVNGAPHSQVLAQTVADNIRAALTSAGGAA